MKKSRVILAASAAVFAFVLILPQACYYDNKEELDTNTDTCDTTEVSYQNDIIPILEVECYTCHSAASNSSGYPFDTYADLKAYADNGGFVDRTNDNNSPMPPSGLLSTCNRDKIRAWVNQGAKNN